MSTCMVDMRGRPTRAGSVVGQFNADAASRRPKRKCHELIGKIAASRQHVPKMPGSGTGAGRAHAAQSILLYIATEF